MNRRDLLQASTTAVATASWFHHKPDPAAADGTAEDITSINAAGSNGLNSLGEIIGAPKLGADKTGGYETAKVRSAIVPMRDPPPLMFINQGGIDGKSTIHLPRVGYSLYKTAREQVFRATSLALKAGVRHFDVATAYGSNLQVAKALQPYLNMGIEGVDKALAEEKPDLMERLEATRIAGETHAQFILGTGGASLAPLPAGSSGRRGRREGLFIHHKIANSEQSTDPVAARRAVKATIAELGCSYLDLVSLHSPLTDKNHRLTSYQALIDLRDSGFVKAVGVCNYGVGALEELRTAKFDLPAVNQLELSPFNQHKDVVEWCDKHGTAISCATWSKLSSSESIRDGWDVVAKIAQSKGMTKAQVLVRWALQKGYSCVPRSAPNSKIERIAIAENSYGGVNVCKHGESMFVLTDQEMTFLNELDVAFPAGKLGRRDGWEDPDVTSDTWDPANFV